MIKSFLKNINHALDIFLYYRTTEREAKKNITI